MTIFLIRALQLILCFSILVILHEGGHFFFAKLFKVRVEKFCLFFDPWFTLFKYKPKHSDTEYSLGWLPLGGYVKIAGMIDESMDTEQMKRPEQPWEFRSKPAWQRLLIMLGGVMVNFLLALFLYAMILYTWGETYVPMRSMTYGMKFNKMAQAYGFRDGDILLQTDKDTFTRFDTNESISKVYRSLSEARKVTVLREGKEVTIQMNGDLNMLKMMKEQPPFVLPFMPSVIDSVVPNSPAEKAGIAKGDKIIAYGGHSISSWNEYDELRNALNDKLAKASSEDSLLLRHTSVVVLRNKSSQKDTLKITLDANYLMGVSHTYILRKYASVHYSYGLFECIPAGIHHGMETLIGYVDDLKYVFTKDGAQSMGSFGTIGSLFPAQWDWLRFWELTAFISIILAFMNVLPIPALDGGHVLFLLIEIVTRRKPSEKILERAQLAGMTILILLMLLAIFNDINRFLL